MAILTSLQGTWEFISGRLLQAGESIPHTQADDWKSFFHVLSWIVLHFTPHGLRSAKLTVEMRDTYDSSYLENGSVYGGDNKEKTIYLGSYPNPGPFLDLLKDLVDVCAIHYEDALSEEEQQNYHSLLQNTDQDPSVTHYHPVKRYNDCREKFTAS